jgi:hypothetical protein
VLGTAEWNGAILTAQQNFPEDQRDQYFRIIDVKAMRGRRIHRLPQ